VFVERPRPRTVEPAAIEALRQVSPSTLGHSTDLVFVRDLTPLIRPLKLVGPALTVKIPHTDSTAVHVALDLIEAGDVLVIDTSGDHSHAAWGGLGSYAAVKRGAAGIVVDGPVTDYSEILDLGLPVFCRGLSPITTRIKGTEGAINVPVSIGGVTVNPGDVIFGDEDGMAVLNPSDAKRVADDLAQNEAAEQAIKAKLDAGESLATLSSARALFEERRVQAPE
jgi:4-hydroxy-4-methyl-2-oxoglutarate aldolase